MILRHRIMLTLRENPINHLVETLTAEIQLHMFKVMRRTVAYVMIKAEVFLVVPKVKDLATHVANLCWVIRQHDFIHFPMHTSRSAGSGRPAEFFLPPNGWTVSPAYPCFPAGVS